MCHNYEKATIAKYEVAVVRNETVVMTKLQLGKIKWELPFIFYSVAETCFIIVLIGIKYIINCSYNNKKPLSLISISVILHIQNCSLELKVIMLLT